MHSDADRSGPDLPTATPSSAELSRAGVEQPGTVIGRYTLIEPIGSGGFGAVFLAEQREPVTRKVALKILKLGLDTRQVIARFEQERETLALMDHPHIAKVLDAGATELGRPYFVMERVDGHPITRYCDEHALTVRQRLELFEQVCNAVQHAHQKGIIHRDIKPGNVLVSTHDDRPHAKVIDFGIAKATDQPQTLRTMFTEMGQFIGTPEYMSPEQAEGSPDIDTRADVYSLGVLLYELLTGVTPFDPTSLRGAAFGEMQRVIREVDPPRPSAQLSGSTRTLPAVARSRGVEPQKLPSLLRGELDWIAMKALEKDRKRRYQTANGLAMDIQRYLAGEAVVAAPPSASYRLRKFVARHKGPVIAALLVLLALIGGIVGTSVGLVRAERASAAEAAAKEEAQRQADIAREVNQFLTRDLLSAADPTRTANRQITVREVIDQAALHVGERFQTAPLVGASIEHVLGDLYVRFGEFDAARRHTDRAYALFRQSLGETARETLDARRSIDNIYMATGHFEEGIKAAEESSRIMMSALGPDDPLTLSERMLLASMYSGRTQYDRAEPIFRDTLERQKRVLGERHRETVGTINDLGLFYMNQQKFDQARPLLEEADSVLRGTIGAEDPDTLSTEANLGWTYVELGEMAKAEEMTAHVLEVSRRVLGNEHPQTQLAANNLGVIYVRTGRPALAEPLYREALEVSRRTLGPGNPDLLPSLNNLGKLYSTMNRYDKAEPLLLEAATKARKLLDPGDFDRGAVLMTYGKCLIGLNRPAEAVKVLLEASQSLLARVPPEHPAAQKNFDLLATAFTMTGDARSAASWKSRMVAPAASPAAAPHAP